MIARVPLASLSIGLIALMATACNNTNYSGGGKVKKKPVAKQQPQPDPAPREEAPATVEPKPVVVQTPPPAEEAPPSQVTPLPGIQRPTEDPIVEEAPPVEPTPQPVVQSPPPVQETRGEGNLFVPVTALSNMASGNQISNDDNFAVLKNSSGKVIASGPMSVHTILNGYIKESRGPIKTLVLNIALDNLDTSAADGTKTGHLRIGRYVNGGFVEVANLHGKDDSYYLPNDYNYSVRYKKSGNQISVLRVVGASFGLEGASGGGYNHPEGSAEAPLVATAHPTDADKAAESRNDFQSPLVLDLDKNGKLDLVNVFEDKTKIFFDIDNSRTQRRIGWVKPQDGLLAIDLNKDGRISSGAELFGEHTAQKIGTYENGFLALASFDSDRNGKINAKDKRFHDLLVWTDSNQDGKSQANELRKLSKLKIKEISLAYTLKTPVENDFYVAGNEVRETSTYTTTDNKQHTISDVWFKQRSQTRKSMAANSKRKGWK